MHFSTLCRLNVAAAVAICSALPALAQTSLPRFPAKTYYGDARAKLLAQGYEAVVPKRAAGQCEEENLGRENVCRQWPEMESCAGTGAARCFFVWRHGKMVLEIQTVGDEREIVDRVRCRSGCR
jgi:hypothetical protein